MGFNLRGDKGSLALLSSKRVKAYTRTKADEAFALPSFSDSAPAPPVEPPRRTTNVVTANAETRVEHESDNVKQMMLQHESVFKEQLHELHRLYQKQCALMAESQKGHASHPRSEPPSSNSSLLYNSDSFKPQEDRSFGDASVSKPLNGNHKFSSVFPTQVDGVKPLEVGAATQKPRGDRPMLDLECPAEGRLMLDLERPADDVPFFDLERPAEEYMDIEQGKEKAQVTGLTRTLADASVLSNTRGVKENRDFIMGGSRDVVPGKDKASSWRSKELAFGAGYDCKDTFGSKERILEGYSPPIDLGFQQTTCKEERWSPMLSFTNTLDYSNQYSFSNSVKAASTSGLFQGLPDLNGELSFAENQTSLVRIKAEKHVKERQYIDLEADSGAPIGTTKLPHWLVQPPPPKALRMSIPTNSSEQPAEWQQKTTYFSPQVQAHSKSPIACAPSLGESVKTSTLSEPYHPWSYINTTPQHREISFKEPLSFPLQNFSGESTRAAAQGPHGVAHISGLANEGIPAFSPYVKDTARMSFSTLVQNSPYLEDKERLASRVSSCADRQDIVFDARAASMELLSRISSKETTALSPVLPWYQQKESFASLMHQASNPEPPPSYRASYVSSLDHWESTNCHRVLPMSGVNKVERDVDKMQAVVSNFTGPCLVAGPESHTKGPVFNFLPSGMQKGGTQELSFQGTEATTCNQVGKPFYIGQIAERAASTSNNNDCNVNLRRNVFDLNMSCESLPSEENLDAHHFTESRPYTSQIQVLKQECETISSSDWDVSRGGNKVAHFDEPQKGSAEPQAFICADRVANKPMAFDVSTKDVAQLPPNDGSLLSRAGMLCSQQRHRLVNDTCADYCSGEDETGGGFVEVKSSDASGLTSCESRDAAHLESAKARDDSNTSSGDACQSRESGIPCHKEDVALSSNVQSKRSIVLPLAKANGLMGSQQWGSFFLSTMQCGPGFNTKGDCSALICTEFGDESEAANSIAARQHLSMETAEAAELLLSLGLELPPVAEVGYAISGNEEALDWLANIIPQEENCEAQALGVDMASMAMHENGSIQPASMGVAGKTMDSFELAVLALKPIDPDAESLALQAMDGASITENCSTLPSLRRRPSRRGRAGKDFQREVLRSISLLSRQEVTEDLQIIEGLINSTTEAVMMNDAPLFLEDKQRMSSPESGSQKKARGTKACRGGGKPSGALNVCSWGESTRRKRMGRQRSQRSCLPPGVQSSPFINNTGDGGPLM